MCWFHRIALLLAVTVICLTARTAVRAAENDGRKSPTKTRKVTTVNARGWIARTVLREETENADEPMYYGFIAESGSRIAALPSSNGGRGYSSYYYSPEEAARALKPVIRSSRYRTPDGWSTSPASRYFWTPDGWFEGW